MDYQLQTFMTQVHIARPGKRPPAGFTMIELVIVLVLVGILAAYALPRLNTAALQVTPVAEQIAAEIRYTQNLALTRSESYTFYVNGNTITINNGAVLLSNGQESVTFTGVSVDADPASITFSPRFGQPNGGASIDVNGGGSSVSIQVAGETGYVTVN